LQRKIASRIKAACFGGCAREIFFAMGFINLDPEVSIAPDCARYSRSQTTDKVEA
jgi:hypothetical protein